MGLPGISQPVEHVRTQLPPKNKDYAAINKAASTRQFRNRGEFLQFVKTQNQRQVYREGTTEFVDFLPPTEFAYGVPNRPSTPIKEVLSKLTS